MSTAPPKGCAASYLSDSLGRSWQFPGRDGKAAVCSECPQRSGKEHCSWGEALNPDVSSAVPASCREASKQVSYSKVHHTAGRPRSPHCAYLASLLGSPPKGIVVVCEEEKKIRNLKAELSLRKQVRTLLPPLPEFVLEGVVEQASGSG